MGDSAWADGQDSHQRAAAGSYRTSIAINGQHLLGDLHRIAEANSGQGVGQSTRARKDTSNGLVAVNYVPIAGEAPSWDENVVMLELPAGMLGEPLQETVWISLFVEGMETNALPYNIVK